MSVSIWWFKKYIIILIKALKEESRFENLSPNKKGTLLKSYISKINIDKLEVDSYKILEEEMDLLGLESNRFSNSKIII